MRSEGEGTKRGFWSAVRILLWAQIRSLVNSWRQAGIKSVIGLLGLVAIAGLMGWGVRSLVVEALASVPPALAGEVVGGVAETVFSLVFLGALASQVFTGLIAAFQSLYLAPDLVILFSAPVPSRAIFTVKSVVVAAGNLPMLGFFGVLPAIVYGWAVGAGGGYYAVAAVALLGLWVLGTSLAELINLAVMQVVPRHRAREAVGVMGALGGLVVYALFQLPGLTGGGQDMGQALVQGGGVLEAVKQVPSGWGAVALVRAAAGNLGEAIGWAVALVGLGGGLYLATQVLVERGFRRGWMAVSESSGSRVRRRSRRPGAGAGAGGSREAGVERAAVGAGFSRRWVQIASVARKDLLTLRRDTREWLGLVSPLAIVTIVTFRAVMQAAREGSWGGPASSSLVSVVVMLAVMMTGELASHAFGREGEAAWILNVAPVSGWPVVGGKLIAAAIPAAVAMEAMVAIIGGLTKLRLAVMLEIGAGALLVVLACSAIGLYLSSGNAWYYADYGRGGTGGMAMLLLWVYSFLFLLVFGYGLAMTVAPPQILPAGLVVPGPEVGGLLGWLGRMMYLAIRPFFWEGWQRLAFGLGFSVVVWAAVFLGFLLATVRRVRRGFTVHVVYGGRRRGMKEAG